MYENNHFNSTAVNVRLINMKDKKYHIPNEFEFYFKDKLIVLRIF